MGRIPELRDYLLAMPAEPAEQLGLRRTRFAAVVDRALRAAKARGMTVAQIEEATGVGNTTFYSWRNGTWDRDPVPAKVREFCEGLGIAIEEAYAALGWGMPTGARRKAPTAITEDPDLRRLMRKLMDPKVPETEKQLFRRMMRTWIGEE